MAIPAARCHGYHRDCCCVETRVQQDETHRTVKRKKSQFLLTSDSTSFNAAIVVKFNFFFFLMLFHRWKRWNIRNLFLSTRKKKQRSARLEVLNIPAAMSTGLTENSKLRATWEQLESSCSAYSLSYKYNVVAMPLQRCYNSILRTTAQNKMVIVSEQFQSNLSATWELQEFRCHGKVDFNSAVIHDFDNNSRAVQSSCGAIPVRFRSHFRATTEGPNGLGLKPWKWPLKSGWKQLKSNRKSNR